MLIIMGSWNAKAGNKGESNMIRGLGLEVRNYAGEHLTEFCGINIVFTASATI